MQCAPAELQEGWLALLEFADCDSDQNRGWPGLEICRSTGREYFSLQNAVLFKEATSLKRISVAMQARPLLTSGPSFGHAELASHLVCKLWQEQLTIDLTIRFALFVRLNSYTAFLVQCQVCWAALRALNG